MSSTLINIFSVIRKNLCENYRFDTQIFNDIRYTVKMNEWMMIVIVVLLIIHIIGLFYIFYQMKLKIKIYDSE